MTVHSKNVPLNVDLNVNGQGNVKVDEHVMEGAIAHISANNVHCQAERSDIRSHVSRG